MSQLSPINQGDYRTIISNDATTVSYLTIGKGQGIIVIPGVLSMASDYAEFASCLSDNFTVYILERRGRGMSGPQGEEYRIQKESEDVLAIQRETGASFLVGHSYGGLIALEVARNNNKFSKIAIYEPGVSIEGSMPSYWMQGYVKKLNEKRDFDAFAEFAHADAPSYLAKLPHWMFKLLLRFNFLLHPESKQMLKLLKQNQAEWKEIVKLDNQYVHYGEISAAVLLLYGGRSDSKAVDLVVERLPKVIPHCKINMFPKLDHFGIEKTAPKEVADVIKDFFDKK